MDVITFGLLLPFLDWINSAIDRGAVLFYVKRSLSLKATHTTSVVQVLIFSRSFRD